MSQTMRLLELSMEFRLLPLHKLRAIHLLEGRPESRLGVIWSRSPSQEYRPESVLGGIIWEPHGRGRNEVGVG
jgi:hypothetical protein